MIRPKCKLMLEFSNAIFIFRTRRVHITKVLPNTLAQHENFSAATWTLQNVPRSLLLHTHLSHSIYNIPQGVYVLSVKQVKVSLPNFIFNSIIVVELGWESFFPLRSLNHFNYSEHLKLLASISSSSPLGLI